MKNLNVSPAAAAAELIRRRRQALIERFDTGLIEGALRLRGCRFDALDEETQGFVMAQVLGTLKESEVHHLIAFFDQVIAGERPANSPGPSHRDQVEVEPRRSVGRTEKTTLDHRWMINARP